MKHAATTFGRFLLGLLLCLGLVRAEMRVTTDCRTAAKSKACACCLSPEAGCCSAAKNQAPEPVPALPTSVAGNTQFDVALVSRPVLVVLPLTARIIFPHARPDAARFSRSHSVQSLLCVRTV